MHTLLLNPQEHQKFPIYPWVLKDLWGTNDILILLKNLNPTKGLGDFFPVKPDQIFGEKSAYAKQELREQTGLV